MQATILRHRSLQTNKTSRVFPFFLFWFCFVVVCLFVFFFHSVVLGLENWDTAKILYKFLVFEQG